MGIARIMHSGTKNPQVSARELHGREVARRAAAEGFVLLQNDGVLPLAEGSTVALLGSGAGRTVKGGTGSGDVNERSRVSVYEGLTAAGVTVTSGRWIADYERTYTAARLAWKDAIIAKCGSVNSPDFFQTYADNAFKMPDGRPVTEEDIGSAETGIFVISRIAGEGADRFTQKGDYYLTDREVADLQTLSRKVRKIIILLNTGAQVDLTQVHALANVAAILDIKQPGMEGGNAVADVLLGKVSPCGRLTSTWAKRYEDFPNAATFSHQNGNIQQEYYTEGIYVGYRYFDSFEVEPDYPFGYGLSYTTFSTACRSVTVKDGSVSVSVNVTNTGSTFSARHVVQLYASCPQSGLPKERCRLVAFAKTSLLAPGKSQELELTVAAKDFASFDESKSSWIVEQGEYALWLGDSLRDVTLCGVLCVQADCVLEQVRHVCAMQEKLEELCRPDDGAKAFEDAWHRKAQELGIQPVPYSPAEKKPLSCGEDDIDRRAKEIAASLTREQLIPLMHGEISRSHEALGAAGMKVPGAAGETYGGLCGIGVPGLSMADGPAGLRLINQYDVDPKTDNVYLPGIGGSLEGGFFATPEEHPGADTYYQYCTAFPNGTLVAQTWDIPLIEEIGRTVAAEMEEMLVSWWLAPGMNIHRNPLCGRNFEYYSEDPLVSGACAAAMTRGVQTGRGTGTTIKHFACNNQEDNRVGSDSILSERTLREIYLRGFEIAVKESQPMAIMTSYNKINGVHAANSEDLCMEIARGEWGFRGVIMTDWTTTSPANGSLAWKCMKVGNDLIMPGCTGDQENIRQALADGTLTDEDMRRCAERLISIILRTNACEGAPSYASRF